jgi:transcriptional regulator with XRE-family HTH domain
MATLSEQIRNFVKESPMSPYAIAKEAEIEKSTMSRFMNGGALTMQKIDQLAKVLGLVVSSEVTLRKSVERGRPKMLKEVSKKLSRLERVELADQMSDKAHNEWFSDRRGVAYLSSYGLLFAYNNNPWADGPKYRRSELERVKARLKSIGIKILAEGQGSEKIEDQNYEGEAYTIGWLLDCDEDRTDEVLQIIAEEAGNTRKELSRLHP